MDLQHAPLANEFFEHVTVSPATFVAFLEGPAAAADGAVYFSDIVNNRITKFDPRTNERSVWRTPSGRTNGLLFDAVGRLLACEGNEFGPNDGDRATMELDHDSVYRIDTDGSVHRVLTQPAIQRPNGIALSPDERTLYLVDSCPVVGGHRKIWAFDLSESGAPSNPRVVFDFASGRGGDGMAVDQKGNLYVAAGILRPRGPHESTDVPPGIWIIRPDGKLLGRLPIPEDVLTNVTFGGDDLRTLYITAGKTLFTARTLVPGWVVHRKA